jgi:hypothetical protein
MFLNVGYCLVSSDVILENTEPICVPSAAIITITTMEIKTRINAYSTRPWPFSFGENNMITHLLPLYGLLAPLPRSSLSIDKFSIKRNRQTGLNSLQLSKDSRLDGRDMEGDLGALAGGSDRFQPAAEHFDPVAHQLEAAAALEGFL